MENPNDIDYPSNIVTLDEARQEISRLLESQKKAYYFLNMFCNYSIKEPLITLKGYTELLQRKDLIEQHPRFLQTITHNAERIRRRIDIVRDLAGLVLDGQEGTEFVKMKLPPERIDLNALLSESISLISRNLQYQNDGRARNIELEKEQGHKTQPWTPAEVRVSLVNNLSIYSCNPLILRDILSDLAWLITEEVYTIRIGVDILTVVDEYSAKIIFSCSTYDPLPYMSVLNDFRKFETSATFFDFSDNSLFLYKSWRKLKIYDGKLFFAIQDNTETIEPSTVEITVLLKR